MSFNPILLDDIKSIIEEPISWEKLYDSTVLITGVNGMIASYLVYTLMELNDKKRANIKILGVARNLDKVKKRFGDLADREDFHIILQNISEDFSYDGPIDYIIHAASQTGPKQFTEDPVGTIKANSIGTLNMLEVARIKESKGFLFLSTREIYGKNLYDHEFVTEEEQGATDPTLVRSCYPESKRLSETLCAAFNSQYKLNCKIARIAHTYGPGLLLGDGRVVGDFIKNILDKENIRLNSDGSSVLALTYITDTVKGLFYTLLNFKGLVYNISKDDEAITVKELAQKLCSLYKELGLTVTFKESSTEEKKGYLAHKIPLLSSEKAKSEGWNPSVNLDNGMNRTIKYFTMERNNEKI